MKAKKKTESKPTNKVKRQPPPEIPKPVAFGGTLIRSFKDLPGMLDNFVHITRRFQMDILEPVDAKHLKDDEVSILSLVENCFGKTSSEELTTDEGVTYPAGGLFCLGADGHAVSGSMVLCFKFVPVGRMYPPHDFESIIANSEKIA